MMRRLEDMEIRGLKTRFEESDVDIEDSPSCQYNVRCLKLYACMVVLSFTSIDVQDFAKLLWAASTNWALAEFGPRELPPKFALKLHPPNAHIRSIAISDPYPEIYSSE